jgi:hypothetical protein
MDIVSKIGIGLEIGGAIVLVVAFCMYCANTTRRDAAIKFIAAGLLFAGAIVTRNGFVEALCWIFGTASLIWGFQSSIWKKKP